MTNFPWKLFTNPLEEPNDADVIPGGSLVFSCKAKLQDKLLEDVSWTKDGHEIKGEEVVKTHQKWPLKMKLIELKVYSHDKRIQTPVV